MTVPLVATVAVVACLFGFGFAVLAFKFIVKESVRQYIRTGRCVFCDAAVPELQRYLCKDRPIVEAAEGFLLTLTPEQLSAFLRSEELKPEQRQTAKSILDKFIQRAQESS